ncbi:MAG: hypothetical protein QG583_574 [Patescibacteria group bacterium]|nr:hypothetical protein [Patescibacteria group bacterium]
MFHSFLAFFPILGLFIMPIGVEASFISSLLGKEVLASTNLYSLEQNSQNGLALEANVSSFAMVDGKKGSEIDESVEIGIVAETALSPVTGPSGVSNEETELEDFSLEDLDIYVVRKGDSVAQVAEMFGITPDTIYSANDMKKGDKFKEGDVWLILPVSGVEHKVAKGQTLQGIANLYKISVDDIISANDIGEGAVIAVGENLMIPGGNMLSETKPKTSGTGIAKGGSSVSSVAGYFIKPVPGSIKSRGVKPGHKGVDFAAPTGTPILAAASGKVLKAAMGWNGAFGNMVIVQHSNGTLTLYAHMSKIATSTGSQVTQGQVIGYVGNTGRSTGPHLHFEVRGARNPF